MPRPDILHCANKVYLGIDLQDQLDPDRSATLDAEPVTRDDGSDIQLTSFNNLIEDFLQRVRSGQWAIDRAESDRWLAPRVHFALRLPRSLASDRALWHWLSIAAAAEYVEWRWTGEKGIANDRWFGPVHKQALARLWWGAEIFRDGADYTPVERAFIRQDLPNSYLHRPLVRCRSFALGILNELTTPKGEALSAKQVNNLARVLNLCTAGTPPEARVGFQLDDFEAVQGWIARDSDVPASWDPLPLGPPARDTTESSIAGGRDLAAHGMALATRSSSETTASSLEGAPVERHPT